MNFFYSDLLCSEFEELVSNNASPDFLFNFCNSDKIFSQ